MIKALILDLDDTIFPTTSIDAKIVEPFFDALEAANEVLSNKRFAEAKLALYRRPFLDVANEFGFTNKMISESVNALERMSFDLSIQTYDDYFHLKEITLDKFLVTTGFTKFQQAKINALGISSDFKEVFIDDPMVTQGGKVKVFQHIIREYRFQPFELLVIGDNPNSEIKAGQELGIPTLLIKRNEWSLGKEEKIVHSFSDLKLKIQQINKVNL